MSLGSKKTISLDAKPILASGFKICYTNKEGEEMKEIIIDSKEDIFSSFTRTALYYETDQMGIIHHSNYIRWFEEARLHYMKEIGLPYDALERMGIIIPVLSVECRYRLPVHYDETVRIYMSITKFNGGKMRVAYEVRDEQTGELRSEGASEHGFVDRDFKPVRMKLDYPEVYEILNSHVIPAQK